MAHRTKHQKKKTQNKPPRKALSLSIIIPFLIIVFAIAGSIQWVSISKDQSSSTHTAQKQKQKKLTKEEKAELAAEKIKTDLPAAWQDALADYGGDCDIAVYSEQTGETYNITNVENGRTYRTASTVKVSVLAQLLHERNGELTSSEQSLATSMIEESDNDATSSLFYHDIGSTTALNSLFSSLGMSHSSASISWGATQTTAADQVILMNNIAYGSSYINDASRATILDLMSKVIDEQSWGISKGSETFYLKNGWLTDSNGWLVHSIGYIPATSDTAKDSYTIAVYTDGNSSMADGEAIIEELALATKQILQPKAVVTEEKQSD